MILQQIIQDLINLNIRNKFPKVKKTEHADVEQALLNAICIPFEVKELDCSEQFILDNFDLTPGPTQGLGINLMVGYAICNGNNGTRNRCRRTAIGFDPTTYTSGVNYSAIGNTGGSANAILVAHNHSTTLGQSNGENAATISTPLYSNSGDGSLSQNVTSTSTTSGESGTDKNLPPFIITLFIQRI